MPTLSGLRAQADPQALLFYNDYGGEGLGAKSDRIYELVRSLRAAGRADRRRRPADARGGASPPRRAPSIATNMRRLGALGLLVNISEMDVRIRDVPGTAPTQLDVQKSVYHSDRRRSASPSRAATR